MGSEKIEDPLIPSQTETRLLIWSNALLTWLYISLPAWVWRWCWKPFSWPLSRFIISLQPRNASEWVPQLLALVQLVVGAIDFTFAITYIIAPLAGRYKYYGIVHVIYLIVHTLFVVFFIALENGVNEMNFKDSYGYVIMTFDHRDIENMRTIGEIYPVLFVATTLNTALQIVDLVRHGIYLPSVMTISYEGYFLFLNVTLATGCFFMCLTLMIHCAFRNRSRPVLLQRREDVLYGTDLRRKVVIE